MNRWPMQDCLAACSNLAATRVLMGTSCTTMIAFGTPREEVLTAVLHHERFDSGSTPYGVRAGSELARFMTNPLCIVMPARQPPAWA